MSEMEKTHVLAGCRQCPGTLGLITGLNLKCEARSRGEEAMLQA